MKNVLSIFRSDLRGLFRNFLALVVAVGLCALPALYAWFNIYANWDPYANTGNIRIAVANEDLGYTDDSGEFLSMGNEVIALLREKDSIGWTFVDSAEEAHEGVASGLYYAAIVLPEDFSQVIYNGIFEKGDRPSFRYYVNGKKNAVATKITDSAITSVQSSISEMYIRRMVEKLFENTNVMANEISDLDTVSGFVSRMESIRDGIASYQSVIDSLQESNVSLQKVLADASQNLNGSSETIASGVEAAQNTKGKLQSAASTYASYSRDMSASLSSVGNSLDVIADIASESTLEDSVDRLSQRASKISERAGDLSEKLTNLYDAIDAIDIDLKLKSNVLVKIDSARSIADEMAANIDTVLEAEPVTSTIQATRDAISRAEDSVDSIREMLDDSITPAINGLLGSLSESMDSVVVLLNNLDDATGTITDILTGMGTAIDGVNVSMTDLQTILDSTSNRLEEVIEKLENSGYDTQLSIITGFLGGSPEVMADFFSDPIRTEDHYVYEIENYGSGVAPFYTTLAIWVGMTILVSLIKTNPKQEGLLNPKPHQLFFGRYLLFFVLSQIQTAIIVLGDLYIFKIQCLYPFRFWLAGAVAGLTFSLLIYALTISFGDLGKAVAVVIMVVQIAGSGGTYPIEALPSFFRSVYKYFPFPYAIDAMRECIGGMYEHTYAHCLIYLGLFCVAALVIGLVIRVPLINLNHYIEKRMEDTEMM